MANAVVDPLGSNRRPVSRRKAANCCRLWWPSSKCWWLLGRAPAAGTECQLWTFAASAQFSRVTLQQ